MRVLIVEDNPDVAGFLESALVSEAYAVDIARTGDDAIKLAEGIDLDLLILDLVLPDTPGLEVLRRLRSKRKMFPVLVLTCLNGMEDRIRTLDLGADDYITKPFSIRELLARVRALLRRADRMQQMILRIADLELDRAMRTVRRAGRRIELSVKEFALLEYLMHNAGRVVTRAMIIDHVWNLAFDTHTNVVDVYISYLRKKLGGGSEPRIIETVRGVGYRVMSSD